MSDHTKKISELAKNFKENSMQPCLDSMPLPVMALFYDDDQQDFKVIYCNEALASLVEIAPENLIGLRLYADIFQDASKNSFDLYKEVALKGGEKCFKDFTLKGKKFLQILCYHIEPGCCACVVEDLSEKMRIANELEDARHCIDMALQNTLDYMCFYDADENTLTGDKNTLLRLPHMPKRFENVPQALADRGVLNPGHLERAASMFKSLANGDESASAELELNLSPGGDGEYQWYKMTSVTYKNPSDSEKRILVMVRNIHDEVMYRQAIENETNIDGLTRLYNRKAAEKIIANVSDNSRIHAFFLFDLDNFKGINDTYGHQAGDDTLRFFGALLKKAFRDTDIVFRLGGDEFAAFATGNDEKFIGMISSRILSALAEQQELPFPVRTSIGVCVAASGAHCYDKFYETADKALYDAKKAGKNVWKVRELA